MRFGSSSRGGFVFGFHRSACGSVEFVSKHFTHALPILTLRRDVTGMSLDCLRMHRVQPKKFSIYGTRLAALRVDTHHSLIIQEQT